DGEDAAVAGFGFAELARFVLEAAEVEEGVLVLRVEDEGAAVDAGGFCKRSRFELAAEVEPVVGGERGIGPGGFAHDGLAHEARRERRGGGGERRHLEVEQALAGLGVPLLAAFADDDLAAFGGDAYAGERAA